MTNSTFLLPHLKIMKICRNFVSLQVGMKKVLVKISALVLVIWYSFSVIGFDVHTCSGSGQTFIATVISGTDCEDIHPDHSKSPCRCCHHNEDETHSEEDGISTRPCCSDDWQMIVLTGVRASEGHGHLDEGHCGLCPCILGLHAEIIHSNIDVYGLRALYKPDSGDIVPLDMQRIYNIWRI